MHIQLLLPPMEMERVEMEAIPQSLLEVGIGSLETASPFCLLMEKNVAGERS